MTRRAHATFMLCVGLAAAGCRGKSAGTPAADLIIRDAPPPTIPESRFDVPLTYDITKVLGNVERAVPMQFGSLDSVHQVGDDPNRHFAFVARRGPFTAFGVGSLFHLRATLTYQARGYYKLPIGPTVSAGCGTSTEHPPRAVIELATPLSLTADWHLAAHARLIRVDRASTSDRDRCQVRLLHYDVTDRILDAARGAITDRLPAIDRTIDNVDLTRQVTGWWATLNRPIRLADGVWLLLGPLRLRVGGVTGKAHLLTVHVGLDARPRIVTGEGEPLVPVPPLPPLAADTVSDGFHILMEGIVDYATASRALSQALRGKSVTEQGHTVTIDSLIVSPAPGERLALTVAFHGDAQGSLRLLGVPRFDATQQAIVMPDLDYDLQTDSPLLNVYSWLLSTGLRSLFREKAVVPDAPALERGRQLLLQGLNRKIGDAMTLSAVIDSVAARKLYVTARGLVVRAEARGHATVAVSEVIRAPSRRAPRSRKNGPW